MRNLLGLFKACFTITLLFNISAYCHASDTESAPQPNIPISTATSLAYDNYIKLRNLYTAYQMASVNSWPQIISERALKIGKRGHTVMMLRDRLRRSNDLAAQNDFGGDLFDENLQSAVQTFQQRHGLKADGVAGKDTLAALNVSPQQRAQQIAVNMQRWLYLSTRLGTRYVLVNIPNYHLDLIENNVKVLSMKVIVGKPNLPTPTLESSIARVVFNPYWNVPQSITRKDLAQKIMDDPDYLEKNNMKVFSSQEDDAYQMNPNHIDWSGVAEGGTHYHIRQEPGEKNALGLVKFEFDNPFHVYLHDTPTKELFAADLRDLSHGCVRLEDPFALADYLVKDKPDYDQAHIQDILATQKTKYVKVSNPLPLFITYITAWVDETGILQFRDDIYNQDNPVETAATTAVTPVASTSSEDPY